MRYILIMFLFTSYNALATNYYVANSGDDDNAGTSEGAAWQTLHKVSTYSLSPGFMAGDSIFLKRDDTWNDSLRFYSSGAVGNPIVFAPYGTGNNPIITGFQDLSVSSIGGNKWTGTATNSVKSQNTILINDTLRFKGRWPNSTVLQWALLPTNKTQMIFKHTDTNYVGKEIALKTAPWNTDITRVLSQKTGSPNDTFNFTVPLSYSSGNASIGYWFQNDSSYVDSLYEWAYDSTSKLVTLYSISTPVVKYSSIDTLIKMHKVNYITFSNIVFSGGNIANVCVDSTKAITFPNCINKDGGGYGFLYFNTNSMSVTNDTLSYLLNGGLWSGGDTSIVFEDNYVVSTAIYQGMAKGSNSGISNNSCAFRNDGHLFSVQRNTVVKSGYIPLFIRGQLGKCQYNLIDSFCLVLNDGGGIYTVRNTSTPENYDSATEIKHNIIMKGWTPQLPGNLNNIISGIYLDDNANYLIVDSNTIEKTIYGLFFKGKGHKIRYNTINQSVNYGAIGTPTVNSSDTISHNIVYVSFGFTWGNRLLSLNDTVEYIDYNHYLPIDTGKVWQLAPSTWYSLNGFRAVMPNYDIHATATFPVSATSNTSLFIYNATMTEATTNLGSNYVDIFGNIYLHSVTIEPFGSRLLFPSNLRPSYSIGGINFR